MADKMGQKGDQLSIKLLWISQRPYNMPNIETLSYSFYTMYLKLPGSHSTVLGD